MPVDPSKAIACWVLGQRLVLPSKPENKNPGAARGGEVKEEHTRPRDHCPGIARAPCETTIAPTDGMRYAPPRTMCTAPAAAFA